MKNDDPKAGIPLTVQDGLIAGTPGSVTIIGLDDQLPVFDAISQAGNTFLTSNGAWSCLNGAMGPDTSNKVLIAQVTTNGVMSFELNIQLGTPEGGTEQFVAKDPTGQETQLAGLTYKSSENTSGIDQPFDASSIQNNVSVFPNPTTGMLTLNVIIHSYNSANYYRIYDAIGKTILTKNIENPSGNFIDKIDMVTLPNGLYFIEFSIDGYKSTSKLLKN